MIENIDFTLADVGERGNNGVQTHIHYYLTPDTFKLCLSNINNIFLFIINIL